MRFLGGGGSAEIFATPPSVSPSCFSVFLRPSLFCAFFCEQTTGSGSRIATRSSGTPVALRLCVSAWMYVLWVNLLLLSLSRVSAFPHFACPCCAFGLEQIYSAEEAQMRSSCRFKATAKATASSYPATAAAIFAWRLPGTVAGRVATWALRARHTHVLIGCVRFRLALCAERMQQQTSLLPIGPSFM